LCARSLAAISASGILLITTSTWCCTSRHRCRISCLMAWRIPIKHSSDVSSGDDDTWKQPKRIKVAGGKQTGTKSGAASGSKGGGKKEKNGSPFDDQFITAVGKLPMASHSAVQELQAAAFRTYLIPAGMAAITSSKAAVKRYIDTTKIEGQKTSEDRFTLMRLWPSPRS
jgi:hypothetical protein